MERGDNVNKFLQSIRENNGKVTPELLANIIAGHNEDQERMMNLYERYKASKEGVPILKRQLIDYNVKDSELLKRVDDKVNNMLNNAFEADIVDTKVGYLLGHPITYEYDDGDETKKKSDPTAEEIEKFTIRNHCEDEDAELGKMAAICGYGARLAYVDKEGNERIKNLNPWEVILIGDDIHQPEYSIWYYKDHEGIARAEFYNDSAVYFYSSKDGTYQEEKVIENLFDYNPLFGLANNKELQGDFEKVLMLIDAYNRTISDASNEIEQYRLAYLVLRGMTADDDVDLRHKKIIELLGENDDVSYLTKDINDALIEHHLDRLEKNILRFAKSVDFTDEQFGGNVTGVAMKYKLMSLENKCITAERKMTAALRYQFKVLFTAWRKKGISGSEDDYLKVWFQFTRNLPVNLLEEAQAQVALKGLVSEKTRLSLFSQVDDAQFELDEMEKEQEEAMAMYNLPPIEGGANEKPTGPGQNTGQPGQKDRIPNR